MTDDHADITSSWADITGRPPADEPLTEAGAAERFARLHGDDVRYDHRRSRWLVWAGHRWVPDADAAVTRIGLDFARAWQREALDIPTPKQREATIRHAIALERRDRLESLLRFAEALRPIADAGDRWDVDPWLLGVPNGVVDLRTGELRPGLRGDRITMSTAVAYDPAATCPRWDRFITEIFGDDLELPHYVQKCVGYSLTGLTTEQVLFFLHGAGSNGKGVLTNTLRHVLGDYGHALAFAAIEHDPRPGAASNELAALLGRRFVVSSETSEGRRLDEGRVKWLTGSDPIRARFLYTESFEFVPAAKFWLAANHKPIVRDDSMGFWRRLRLIPFSQTFPIDQTLAATLTEEGAGILAWAIRGCLTWQRETLDPPPAVVIDATRQYREDSDTLGSFIAEAVDVDPASSVGAAELYQHYRSWADRNGLTERERLTANAFGRKVGERFDAVQTRTRKEYLGIGRRPL